MIRSFNAVFFPLLTGALSPLSQGQTTTELAVSNLDAFVGVYETTYKGIDYQIAVEKIDRDHLIVQWISEAPIIEELTFAIPVRFDFATQRNRNPRSMTILHVNEHRFSTPYRRYTTTGIENRTAVSSARSRVVLLLDEQNPDKLTVTLSLFSHFSKGAIMGLLVVNDEYQNLKFNFLRQQQGAARLADRF